MPTIQIKHRYTNAVLFECELTDEQASGNATRHALEQATVAKVNLNGANLDGANLDGANLNGANLDGANLDGANLDGAYLRGANLDGANLGGAYLRFANLRGANLGGANLGGANLDGANLGGANLGGANLGGAYLRGANLGGAYLRGANLGGANLRGANLRGANLGGGLELVGDRPVLAIGPIGSRADTFFAFITDSGVRVRAGCFFGTVDEFTAALKAEHGDNKHAREYTAALVLVAAHAEAWMPSGAVATTITETAEAA